VMPVVTRLSRRIRRVIRRTLSPISRDTPAVSPVYQRLGRENRAVGRFGLGIRPTRFYNAHIISAREEVA